MPRCCWCRGTWWGRGRAARGPLLRPPWPRPAGDGRARDPGADAARLPQLGLHTALWVLWSRYFVGAFGAGCFFPSNNAAVMKAAPARARGGVGAAAHLRQRRDGLLLRSCGPDRVAEHFKHEAFAIFVGTSTLPHSAAAAFTSGIHAAFYSSVSLSACGGSSSRPPVLERGAP